MKSEKARLQKLVDGWTQDLNQLEAGPSMPQALRVKKEPEAVGQEPPNPNEVSARWDARIAEAKNRGDDDEWGRLLDEQIAAFDKAKAAQDAYRALSPPAIDPSLSPPAIDPSAPMHIAALEEMLMAEPPEFALVDRPTAPEPSPPPGSSPPLSLIGPNLVLPQGTVKQNGAWTHHPRRNVQLPLNWLKLS